MDSKHKNELIRSWQWHFSLWFHPRRIYINQLSNYTLEFFGYGLNTLFIKSIKTAGALVSPKGMTINS